MSKIDHVCRETDILHGISEEILMEMKDTVMERLIGWVHVSFLKGSTGTKSENYAL